jgi:hypothetical protein
MSHEPKEEAEAEAKRLEVARKKDEIRRVGQG